nr:pentatricopeptide repeat-containing protein [Tanacetum cinerariifolium]
MAPSGSQDAINISYEELVERAEKEAQTTYVLNKFNIMVNDDFIELEKVADKGNKRLNDDAIPVKKAVDKGKTKMVEDDHLVKKPVRRNKGIVIGENVNPSVMDSVTDSKTGPDVGINFTLYSDSDSEYSDKSTDYLSQGEDKLIDLRKRKTKAKKASKSSKKQTLPDKVGSSSSIRQMRVYEVGDSETIIEHEEFMDDLITKLGAEGGGLIDPFRIVESKVEKFSLWFHTSLKTKVIAKCGLRPKKLKEQEKGKPRKWKRYSSTSTSEVKGSNCLWRCYGKEMTNKKSFQGLIESVKEVMPYAEHRQCARHIYEGFRKEYSDVEFRSLFWVASKATYLGFFNKIIDKIKRANLNAYEYLVKKDPKSWSRAHFQIGTNCEAVKNGFSECFNFIILRVRNKPLITMLEAMRVIVLERLNTMRRFYDTWTEDICLNIQKRLELTKDLHRRADIC